MNEVWDNNPVWDNPSPFIKAKKKEGKRSVKGKTKLGL